MPVAEDVGRDHEGRLSGDDAFLEIDVQVLQNRKAERAGVVVQDHQTVDAHPSLRRAAAGGQDGHAVVVRPVSGDVDDAPATRIAVPVEHRQDVLDHPADGGAASGMGPPALQLGQEPGRRSRAVDDPPVDDCARRPEAGPFHIGERDPSQRSRGDRGDHLVAGQGGDVSLALEHRLGGVDRAGDIDGKHQFEIDGLLRPRRHGGTQHRQDEQRTDHVSIAGEATGPVQRKLVPPEPVLLAN